MKYVIVEFNFDIKESSPWRKILVTRESFCIKTLRVHSQPGNQGNQGIVRKVVNGPFITVKLALNALNATCLIVEWWIISEWITC